MDGHETISVDRPSRPALTLPPVVGHKRRNARPPTVDVAMGCGHPDMDVAALKRGLARIAAKGVRTGRVRKVAGVPFVMTKDLPEGVAAVSTVRGFEAVRLSTSEVVATVEACPLPAGTTHTPI